MELKIGTQISYTSAAGTKKATIKEIKIGKTADPKRMNTWITLDVPAQNGAKFDTTVTIPGDTGSLKAFKVYTI